jgi:hypothetical protein
MSDTATTTIPAAAPTTSEKQILLSILYGLVLRSTNFSQEADRNLNLGAVESLARAANADVQHIATSLRTKVRDFIVEKGLAVVPPDADPQPAAAAVTGADLQAAIAAHDDELLAKIAALIPGLAAPATPVATPVVTEPVTTAPGDSSVPTV